MVVKQIIKNFLPPIALDAYRKILKGKNENIFKGGFDSWLCAVSNSTGYNDQKIFDKVLKASLSIKDRDDKYERDSIIFEGNDYPWSVLGPLLWIAHKFNGTLSVIDYGGSLGNVFFRSSKVLESLDSVNWVVIEQEKFCNAGREYFENDKIIFYENIDEPLKSQSINVALFSSSLQYLENPYEILLKLINSNIKYFIFDRTPFSNCESDRVVVQRVPSEIYSASYPMWIFSRKKFEKFLEFSNARYLTKSIALEGAQATSDAINFSFENLVIEIPNDK
jgi:putative methyltransferase (TIGR04325 family)